MSPIARLRLTRWIAIAIAVVGGSMVSMSASAAEADATVTIPPQPTASIRYLLDLAAQKGETVFDGRQIEPLIDFLVSPKSADTLYRADGSFDAPSAYHQFDLTVTLRQIIDYTLNRDIPSFFFWPSSLRFTNWTRVEGGPEQFDRLKSASTNLDFPFLLRGAEHVTITPDQHTGAYYSYDVDKMIVLSPFREGRVMISIYRQQAPSEVGRRGWVLGQDDEWSYLYTQDNGLNMRGLGWVKTYMYDSFGITVYYQPSPDQPLVTCGVVSWVNAGWAKINMVQPKHIHNGLVRVSHAFTDIMENPRLPEPEALAAAFSKSKTLPTAVLKEYAGTYLTTLKARVAESAKLWSEVADDFDSRALLEQMNRDELYAVLALDYFKKLLGRNPVMDSHPF